ncbi:hypothetical protein QBC35DRAFT_513979 [Podospora australis]|uniref:Thioredoxin domain-containing protein n=1 Tax=Podospora australis TaxID=1536484 RepID=A0AAN7AJK3_9PEZI|nr:hypothetical protein QBC35DRAFT_513979 [Podospora australis]
MDQRYPSRPQALSVQPVPEVGDRAPSLGRDVRFPSDRPVVVVFLRHCGCPFAEKTFKTFTKFSTDHPEIRCVAVSQSSTQETDAWIIEVGGEWEVHVIVDESLDLFKLWGLGQTSTWYAYSPWTVWSAVKLGKEEGIWNREQQTGSRFQQGGAFAVDSSGFVRWAKPAQTAEEIPNFKEALRALRLPLTARTKRNGLA